MAAVEGEPGVELVDWKTGKQPDQAAGGLDQLTIYALALRELGELPGGRCIASYCYLGGDEPEIETRSLGPADLDRQRALLDLPPGRGPSAPAPGRHPTGAPPAAHARCRRPRAGASDDTGHGRLMAPGRR